MKKETIIAIVLGVIFGVVVAGVMIFKTKGVMTKNTNPVISTTSVTPTITVSKTSQSQAFSIQQPDTDTIQSTKTLSIVGKAIKDSLIIVQSPISSLSLKNDKEDFKTDFPLALGENIIHISVYPKDGSAVQEKELKVYFLDEK